VSHIPYTICRSGTYYYNRRVPLSYAAPQLKVKSNSNASFVQFIFKKIVSEE